MRIVTHLRAFYDYVPCPAGVTPTDDDIRSGRAKRKGPNEPWLMRVKKAQPSHNFTSIPEVEIVKHMVGMAMPANGKQVLSRKAAVADYLSKMNARAVHWDNTDVSHFEVHDDEHGPAGTPTTDAVLREVAGQYTTVTHPGSGAPLLTPSDVDAMAAAYKEPAGASDHVDHLHTRFGVPKKGA